jgi:ubiquinone/menaquinone biosynthesis C-methylase UbiE
VGQYDEVAEAYEARIVPHFRPIAERLLRSVDLLPGDRVLDVAAGTGGLSRLMAPRIGRDGSLVLADLSAPMLAIADRVLRELPAGPLGRPRAETLLADLEHLPLPNDSFDVVAGQMTPLLDSQAGIREAYRVLRPGGRFAVAAWGARYQETALLNVARAAVGVGPYPKVHLRAIAKRLATAGFVDVHQRTRPMVARHASLAAYLDYRLAFGTVGYTRDVLDTYLSALQQEVRRQVGETEPLPIGWSITIVSAAKPEAPDRVRSRPVRARSALVEPPRLSLVP